jgi:hypothetical protein
MDRQDSDKWDMNQMSECWYTCHWFDSSSYKTTCMMDVVCARRVRVYGAHNN